MAQLLVASVVEMLKALDAAKALDVIALKPGKYSGIGNYNRPFNKDGLVTITAADPKNKAVVTDFFLTGGMKNVMFKGLDLDASAAAQRQSTAFIIMNSENCGIDSCHIHGDMTLDPRTAANKMTVAAVSTRMNKNFTFNNNDVERFPNGLGHQNCDGLKITNNKFHNLRSDNIAGGGSSNVLIDKNSITDSYPQGNPQHPDGIQFFTSGTTASAVNITVTNNIIDRGVGGQGQGLFMGNELNIPYKNVTVKNNRITGGMFHALTVFCAEDVVIVGNVTGLGPVFKDPLLPVEQQGLVGGTWIKAGGVKRLRCDSNWADAYSFDGITDLISFNWNHINGPGLIGKVA